MPPEANLGIDSHHQVTQDRDTKPVQPRGFETTSPSIVSTVSGSLTSHETAPTLLDGIRGVKLKPVQKPETAPVNEGSLVTELKTKIGGVSETLKRRQALEAMEAGRSGVLAQRQQEEEAQKLAGVKKRKKAIIKPIGPRQRPALTEVFDRTVTTQSSDTRMAQLERLNVGGDMGDLRVELQDAVAKRKKQKEKRQTVGTTKTFGHATKRFQTGGARTLGLATAHGLTTRRLEMLRDGVPDQQLDPKASADRKLKACATRITLLGAPLTPDLLTEAMDKRGISEITFGDISFSRDGIRTDFTTFIDCLLESIRDTFGADYFSDFDASDLSGLVPVLQKSIQATQNEKTLTLTFNPPTPSEAQELGDGIEVALLSRTLSVNIERALESLGLTAKDYATAYKETDPLQNKYASETEKVDFLKEALRAQLAETLTRILAEHPTLLPEDMSTFVELCLLIPVRDLSGEIHIEVIVPEFEHVPLQETDLKALGTGPQAVADQFSILKSFVEEARDKVAKKPSDKHKEAYACALNRLLTFSQKATNSLANTSEGHSHLSEDMIALNLLSASLPQYAGREYYNPLFRAELESLSSASEDRPVLFLGDEQNEETGPEYFTSEFDSFGTNDWESEFLDSIGLSIGGVTTSSSSDWGTETGSWVDGDDLDTILENLSLPHAERAQDLEQRRDEAQLRLDRQQAETDRLTQHHGAPSPAPSGDELSTSSERHSQRSSLSEFSEASTVSSQSSISSLMSNPESLVSLASISLSEGSTEGRRFITVLSLVLDRLQQEGFSLYRATVNSKGQPTEKVWRSRDLAFRLQSPRDAHSVLEQLRVILNANNTNTSQTPLSKETKSDLEQILVLAEMPLTSKEFDSTMRSLHETLLKRPIPLDAKLQKNNEAIAQAVKDHETKPTAQTLKALVTLFNTHRLLDVSLLSAPQSTVLLMQKLAQLSKQEANALGIKSRHWRLIRAKVMVNELSRLERQCPADKPLKGRIQEACSQYQLSESDLMCLKEVYGSRHLIESENAYVKDYIFVATGKAPRPMTTLRARIHKWFQGVSTSQTPSLLSRTSSSDLSSLSATSSRPSSATLSDISAPVSQRAVSDVLTPLLQERLQSDLEERGSETDLGILLTQYQSRQRSKRALAEAFKLQRKTYLSEDLSTCPAEQVRLLLHLSKFSRDKLKQFGILSRDSQTIKLKLTLLALDTLETEAKSQQIFGVKSQRAYALAHLRLSEKDIQRLSQLKDSKYLSGREQCIASEYLYELGSRPSTPRLAKQTPTGPSLTKAKVATLRPSTSPTTLKHVQTAKWAERTVALPQKEYMLINPLSSAPKGASKPTHTIHKPKPTRPAPPQKMPGVGTVRDGILVNPVPLSTYDRSSVSRSIHGTTATLRHQPSRTTLRRSFPDQPTHAEQLGLQPHGHDTQQTCVARPVRKAPQAPVHSEQHRTTSSVRQPLAQLQVTGTRKPPRPTRQAPPPPQGAPFPQFDMLQSTHVETHQALGIFGDLPQTSGLPGLLAGASRPKRIGVKPGNRKAREKRLAQTDEYGRIRSENDTPGQLTRTASERVRKHGKSMLPGQSHSLSRALGQRLLALK